jgi:hypothetical protein
LFRGAKQTSGEGEKCHFSRGFVADDVFALIDKKNPFTIFLSFRAVFSF